MMKMQSRTFADVFERVDKLDDSVGLLSQNLQTLTEDVHSIKGIIENAQGGLNKLVWIAAAALVGGALKLMFF